MKSYHFISLLVFVGFAFAQTEPAAQMRREPIRVGGNVQESKLVSKIDPVYPTEAKTAGISGVVILQATIDEEGAVADLKVLRGRPLLDQAAITAVRQWRYSPTLLNGEPVAVIATVTVAFGNTSAAPPTMVIMDEKGNLTEPGGKPLSPDSLGQLKSIRIQAGPNLPLRQLEDFLRNLQAMGVEDIQLRDSVFREGRLFYWSAIALTGAETVSIVGNQVQAPELVLDMERLADIAMRTRPPAGPSPVRPQAVYQVFIVETGEIVRIEQMAGPKLPELEAEILRTRVVTPGRRGVDPVPVTFFVSVPLPQN
jgi:TonB family protein